MEHTSAYVELHNSFFYKNKGDLVIGGVMYQDYSTVILNNCGFSNNAAYFGGVMANYNSDIKNNNSIFNKNTVKLLGGVMYNNHSNISMIGITLNNNTAGAGGTLYNKVSRVNVQRSIFFNNKADSGGAMASEESNVLIVNTILRNNKVFFIGGAIALFKGYNPSSLLIKNCFVTNNTAKWAGGAIISFSANIVTENSTFAFNSASIGGAMANYNSMVSIHKHCIFVANSARQVASALTPEDILNRTTISQITNNSHYIVHLPLDIFIKTSMYSGGALYHVEGSIEIQNSIFVRNQADVTGGALCTSGDPEYDSTINVTIKNIVFAHNTGNLVAVIATHYSNVESYGKIIIQNNTSNALSNAVIAISSTVTMFGNLTFSNNVGSFFVIASNVTFNGQAEFANNSQGISILQTELGGAVSGFQSNLMFTGSVNVVHNNAANRNRSGGGISVAESKLYLNGNITIALNKAKNGGGIFAYQSEIKFEGRNVIKCNTAIKYGGGIYTVGSNSIVSGGSLLLLENSAEKGGGMFLEQNAKIYIVKTEYTYYVNVNFTGNYAHYGGAVYVSDYTITGTCGNRGHTRSINGGCFLQMLVKYGGGYKFMISIAKYLLNTYFVNNTALHGKTLYGGMLDRCTLSPIFEFDVFQEFETDLISYITAVTNLKKHEIKVKVSSLPVRVCYCQDNKPNCSYKPPELYVRKGKSFTISLVAVDHVNNTIPNSTILSYLSAQAGLKEGESIQKSEEGCTELTYAVVSPHASEKLHLYADGPCKDIGISVQTISIMFVACPIGFKDTDTNCICDPVLSNYISDCSIDKESVLRKSNSWITFENTTKHQSLIAYPNCSFDYCYPPTEHIWINLNVPNDSDKQCSFNRSGKLCGSCKKGLSLTLGSSNCVQCSNNWLSLLIVFIFAGVALVALLLLCNFTVAAGTINGLLFYANIVSTNHATLFQFEHSIGKFFYYFIAWLNFDFGFETCFFNGMDGYWKTWLQLAFPAYVIILVILIIKACDYSLKFARLIARKNPVATLATLILLSYTKLLQTIISAWQFATLEYNDGTQETVWLVDANVRYLESKHIPLFIAALIILVIVLVYTIFLFLWQWLLLCPNRKPFKWIRNSRLHAVMDAYFIPYNKQHRYWTGLLLLARALLYLVSSLSGTVTGDPTVSLYSIIFVVGSLILWKELTKGNIYRKWPLNVLDTSFLFNLLMFAAATLYVRDKGGNQTAISYISVTTVFISFLIILIFHTFLFLKTCFESIKIRSNEQLTDIAHCETFSEDESDVQVSFSEVDGLPPPLDTDSEGSDEESVETRVSEGDQCPVDTSMTTSKKENQDEKELSQETQFELQDVLNNTYSEAHPCNLIQL